MNTGIFKISIALVALGACALCGGCNVAGLVASPTSHEKKVPAEYKLADRAEDKILIFVDKAPLVRSGPGLADELSQLIKAFLVKRARIDPEYIILYDKSRLKPAADILKPSPCEVGESFDAGVVLYVLIEDYKLYEVTEGRYHAGSLVSRSVLFDVSSRQLLWPIQAGGRQVRTKVDLETKGADIAVNHLTAATAFCIGRHLYDCPKDMFRTSYEDTDVNFDF